MLDREFALALAAYEEKRRAPLSPTTFKGFKVKGQEVY